MDPGLGELTGLGLQQKNLDIKQRYPCYPHQMITEQLVMKNQYQTTNHVQYLENHGTFMDLIDFSYHIGITRRMFF